MKLYSIIILVLSLAFCQVTYGKVVIDTDAMTIDGVASGGTFNGTPFNVVELPDEIVQFRFEGDLLINDETAVAEEAAPGEP
jgi:hypothetical protein